MIFKEYCHNRIYLVKFFKYTKSVNVNEYLSHHMDKIIITRIEMNGRVWRKQQTHRRKRQLFLLNLAKPTGG